MSQSEHLTIKFGKPQQLDEQSVLSSVHLGRELHQKGQYEEAEALLQHVVNLNGEEISETLCWAYHILASYRSRDGQLDEAIHYYQKAIKCKPNFGHFYRLAQIYNSKGETEQAIKAYCDAIHLKKDADAYIELGTLLLGEEKKFEEASECFKQSALMSHHRNLLYTYLDHPIILNHLSRAYKCLGKYHEASELEESVSIFTELNSKNDVLLVSFASRNDTVRNHQFRFQFRKMLNDVDIKKIFIRDVEDAWYSKGIPHIANSLDEFSTYLRHKIKLLNPSKLVLVGSSAGGYAALLFGLLLEADVIHAFSPQTVLPRSHPFPDENLLRGCDSKYFCLSELNWESVKTQFNIYYSEEFIEDKKAAERMKKFKNFVLHSYQAGEIHNIAGYLKNNGELKSIMLNSL